MTAGAAIEVKDLVVGYDGVPVLRGLDLTVGRGQIVALLGANGAGKTTTVMTIAGAVRPMSGSVRVLGQLVDRLRPHDVARLGVSFVPETRGVLFQLTVEENLRLQRHRGSAARIDDVLDLFPTLRPIMSRKAGLLSGGEQQMLGLGCALMADPTVLLIDELSHGLAPVIVEHLLPVISSISRERGVAILLVEQHVGAALQVADHVYILGRGRVVASGSSAELRQDQAVLEASYLGSARRVSDDQPSSPAPRHASR